MKDLYYEITDSGYHIYDRNDELFHVHQYEPYIPDKNKSYEENAEMQIHSLMVNSYISLVASGSVTIDEVPEEYVEAVRNATAEPESANSEIEEKAKAYDILVGADE